MYHFSREYTQSPNRWQIVYGPDDDGTGRDVGYDEVGSVDIITDDDGETYYLNITSCANLFGHKLDRDAVHYDFMSFILKVIMSLQGTIEP